MCSRFDLEQCTTAPHHKKAVEKKAHTRNEKNEKWRENDDVSCIRFSLVVCSHLHYRFKFSFISVLLYSEHRIHYYYYVWLTVAGVYYTLSGQRTLTTEIRVVPCGSMHVIVFDSGQINCCFVCCPRADHTMLCARARITIHHRPVCIKRYLPHLISFIWSVIVDRRFITYLMDGCGRANHMWTTKPVSILFSFRRALHTIFEKIILNADNFIRLIVKLVHSMRPMECTMYILLMLFHFPVIADTLLLMLMLNRNWKRLNEAIHLNLSHQNWEKNTLTSAIIRWYFRKCTHFSSDDCETRNTNISRAFHMSLLSFLPRIFMDTPWYTIHCTRLAPPDKKWFLFSAFIENC